MEEQVTTRSQRPAEQTPAGIEPPLVSVIVPVRNSGNDLAELLDSLDHQTFPRSSFEIVIGDDGSSDGSVAAYATGDGWIRVARGPLKNSYAARNRAIREASAEIIACCDADCRPEQDWLERGFAAMNGADIVAGAIRFTTRTKTSIWSLVDMDTFLDNEIALRSGYAVTANLFFRRELYERVGGFDESLPNQGDHDFVKRCVAAGAKTKFAPGALVWHPTRDNAWAYLKKVWYVNLRYAQREAVAGRLPEGLKLRSWIPLLQTIRARQRVGRPLLLNTPRLAESGTRPTAGDHLRALPIIYVVVPLLRNFAQLQGWLVTHLGRRNK